MNKDTFDILHSEFDECPQLPDSLSKSNVVAKLKNVSQEKQATISFKKLGTLAAALIVVMVCAIVATPSNRDNHEIAQDSMATTSPLTQPAYNNQIIPEGETALLRADSREEILEMFKKSYKENSNKYGR